MQANELDLALDVYGQLVREGCTPNLVTYNILIDIYGKTAQWQEAIKLLDAMHSQVGMLGCMAVQNAQLQTLLSSMQSRSCLDMGCAGICSGKDMEPHGELHLLSDASVAASSAELLCAALPMHRGDLQPFQAVEALTWLAGHQARGADVQHHHQRLQPQRPARVGPAGVRAHDG